MASCYLTYVQGLRSLSFIIYHIGENLLYELAVFLRDDTVVVASHHSGLRISRGEWRIAIYYPLKTVPDGS